jgi:5-methylthioadenosine/S-adenosylhomocysteine deaminase
MQKEIGSLEAGKLADVVAFDLDTPHASPATNPIASLVFSARGTDAHTVVVNGCEVVRDRKVTTFQDVKKLQERARNRAKEVVREAGLSARAQSAWAKST